MCWTIDGTIIEVKYWFSYDRREGKKLPSKSKREKRKFIERFATKFIDWKESLIHFCDCCEFEGLLCGNLLNVKTKHEWIMSKSKFSVNFLNYLQHSCEPHFQLEAFQITLIIFRLRLLIQFLAKLIKSTLNMREKSLLMNRFKEKSFAPKTLCEWKLFDGYTHNNHNCSKHNRSFRHKSSVCNDGEEWNNNIFM